MEIQIQANRNRAIVDGKIYPILVSANKGTHVILGESIGEVPVPVEPEPYVEPAGVTIGNLVTDEEPDEDLDEE